MKSNLDNITPGEILLEEYLIPLGLTQNALARALDVPPRRVNEIVLGKRAITLDTSLRLGRYFGQSPRFWLNIQMECDFRRAGRLVTQIARAVRPMVMVTGRRTPEKPGVTARTVRLKRAGRLTTRSIERAVANGRD